MLKSSLALAAAVMAGHASAQESYVYGGLGLVQTDYTYEYTPASETTDFDSSGESVFLGYGRVLSTAGQMSFAGEVDIAFGNMDSDRIVGGTTPCITPGEGCTGTVNSLATLRAVMAASGGTLRPFASAGLAFANVEGSADLGACNTFAACSYDENLFGLALGLGATYDLTDQWSLRGEVMYVNLGQPEFTNRVQVLSDDITLTQVRLGAQFRF